jgi:biotin carboxylase
MKNPTRPIRRVLIANRGEIAVRIQRACRELGIEVVQVYSEADRNSMAVQLADHAVCIGAARSSESYLKADTVIEAAKAFNADAIHPGYGFLSENASFARLCEQQDVIFIGPPSDVIATMGDKASARAMALAAGMPITPGSSGIVTSAADALAIAETIGYPVILKAVAGGGGRGTAYRRTQRPLLPGILMMRHGKRKRLSATAQCIWRNISSTSGMSRFRFCRTGTTFCTSASVTVLPNGEIRSWSRKVPRQVCLQPCAPLWESLR